MVLWSCNVFLCRTCYTVFVVCLLFFFFFFFQAEDGIRDLTVTGVQTCALPICRAPVHRTARGPDAPARPGPSRRWRRESPPRRGIRTPSRRGGDRHRRAGSGAPHLQFTPRAPASRRSPRRAAFSAPA